MPDTLNLALKYVGSS